MRLDPDWTTQMLYTHQALDDEHDTAYASRAAEKTLERAETTQAWPGCA